MSAGTITLKMWLMQKTDRAVKVTERAKIGEHRHAYQIWWLPRSQIDYSRTEPAAVPGELPTFVFTLPGWLVQKQNLSRFETDAK